MRRFAFALAALVMAGVLLAACGLRVPSDPPAITGTITSAILPTFARTVGSTTAGTILVEGSGAVGDKASLTLKDSTTILEKAADGTTADASVRDLKVGLMVQVWVDGPVAESYPVQGTASVVLILR